MHLLLIPRQSSDAARLYNEFESGKNEQESYNKSRNLFHVLDQNRQEWWKETVSKLNFTHSSCKAWQTVNRLSGDSGLGKGSTLSQQTPQHHSWSPMAQTPNWNKALSHALKNYGFWGGRFQMSAGTWLLLPLVRAQAGSSSAARDFWDRHLNTQQKLLCCDSWAVIFLTADPKRARTGKDYRYSQGRETSDKQEEPLTCFLSVHCPTALWES